MSSQAEAVAAPPRRNAAALVWHQIRYEQLSFWRNPQSAFFLFAFPLVFFAILAGVFGNAVLFKAGGRTVTGLQYYTSTIAAVSVMGACYSQLAITLSLRRQEGILKRLRGTPLPAWVMFAGLVAHCIIVSLIDVALILIMGLLYGVPLPGHWDAIIVTLVVGAAAFCALGVAVATLVSNAEAAPAVVQFVFFPLVFISGTYFNITSRFLNDLAGIFPVRPFNQALLNPFAFDRGFAGHQLLVLAIWGMAGGFVGIRRFRWDPRPE
ncbi:MAG: ABC transporter permease [Streptosporangiaceae bacterium]